MTRIASTRWRLTRPQRRLVFGLPLAISCCIIVAWLWLATRTTWFPGAGLMMKEYGFLRPVVTVTTQSAAPGVATGPTAAIGMSSLAFDPLGIAMAAVASIAVIALCIWTYRRAMRERVLIGRCDECGYDLRGTSEPRCPECGAAVKAAASPSPEAR